jgi:DNA-binding Lrp family transcriptional regulator
VDAYVLIQIDAGAGSKVRAELASVPGVRIAHAVTGPYDLVARAQVADMDALGVLLNEVQLIPGLTRTLTCIVKGQAG